MLRAGVGGGSASGSGNHQSSSTNIAASSSSSSGTPSSVAAPLATTTVATAATGPIVIQPPPLPTNIPANEQRKMTIPELAYHMTHTTSARVDVANITTTSSKIAAGTTPPQHHGNLPQGSQIVPCKARGMPSDHDLVSFHFFLLSSLAYPECIVTEA